MRGRLWKKPASISLNSRLDYVRAALETCKGKFKIFSELPGYCGFYFKDDFEYNPDGVAKHFVPENKPRLLAVREAFAALENFDAANLETALKATAAQLGVKVGALVHPTRLAVTGSNAGPSLYHLLEILGKEKVLARIDRALALFWVARVISTALARRPRHRKFGSSIMPRAETEDAGC